VPSNHSLADCVVFDDETVEFIMSRAYVYHRERDAARDLALQTAYVYCTKAEKPSFPSASAKREWFKSTMRKVFLGRARTERRRSGLFEKFPQALMTSTSLPENIVLRDALKCLTDDERQVVVRRWVDGETIHALAQELGQSVHTIKRLDRDALEKLRNCLEAQTNRGEK